MSALFSVSIHTSENTVSIMRLYENSVERNTSGTLTVLLSLDVKFVKIFRKETKYYQGHCNSSPNLHNRLIHMDIITANQNSMFILDSLM